MSDAPKKKKVKTSHEEKDDGSGDQEKKSPPPSLGRRFRSINNHPMKRAKGPVVYWMSRDQRLEDNWAVLYAQFVAQEYKVPLEIVFNLANPLFPGANHRSFHFMLHGLLEVQKDAHAKGIPFHLLQGDAKKTIPAHVKKTNATALITDFSTMRIGREWREAVKDALEDTKTPYHEVDAHNIVPSWIVSDKREYGARTIRTKCHKHQKEFLTDFPSVDKFEPASKLPALIDPDQLMEKMGSDLDRSVKPVSWCKPGPAAARANLDEFLSKRIKSYGEDRNKPHLPHSLSNVSPWLHFGSISAQRCVLEAAKYRSKASESVNSFIEEIFVRRELSDNFLYHTPDYDKVTCAHDWARESLDAHKSDKREHLYTRDQLEAAKTHDDMWNAAQQEMVARGKMHGYMRMYWCKKILEWTENAQQALDFAIYLNDKYNLDGRDPNGYVGVAWSILGIHDQGWAERAIFGKIRYMNYGGLQRKFKKDGIASYVKYAKSEYKKYKSS